MNKLIPAVSWQKTIQKFTDKYICEFRIQLTNYLYVFLNKKYKFNNYLLLINKKEAFDVYTTSNVMVRKCFREKNFYLKFKTVETLEVIYDNIFIIYFKKNPLC